MVRRRVANVREKRKEPSHTAAYMFFNVKGVALAFVCLLCLNMILYYGVDPEGFDMNKTPRAVRFTFSGVTYPLLATLLLTILFHWADLYNTTTEMLKKEEMLEKINAKYKSDLKLEDVLSKIRFVNRLKLPFVIIVIISYVLTAILYALIIVEAQNITSIVYIWAIFFVALYLVITIGFTVYGRKLIGVLPNAMAKRMRKVTRLTTIQSVVFCFCFLLGVITFFATNSFWAFLLTYYLLRGAMLFIVVTMLSMFVRVSRRWPFIEFTKSNKSTERSGSITETAEVSMTNSVNP